MNQTDRPDEERPAPSRIPVRFEEGGDDEAARANNDSGLTPEELGEASIYEDAGEMRRRIDRGREEDTEEGRERADDADVAGAAHPSERPRSRDEQDTTPSHADDESKSAHDEAGRDAQEPPRRAATAEGPVMAELVATRAELRRVEGELKREAEERQELLDKLARRAADFDNFRKRTERERKDIYNNALGEVVGRFLPVLDNLQRALETERSKEAAESEEFRHFLQGVELIGRQLGGVLEALGIEPVPTVGHPFDPHVHEAVATVETEEFDADHVVEEMRRGYRLGDKLLRPAMVKVSKGREP